jgi:COP9 signalosome complex subunit 6
LGWYCCGDKPTTDDLNIHKQVSFLEIATLKAEVRQLLSYNENPLFLQITPDSVTHGKELPVVVYECITEIVNNQSQSLFIRCPYRIETGEAERVAVDHAAKPSGQGAGAENAGAA